MKKLIIVLMVVAVASFLFVGCLGVTPPVDDVDDVDDVVDVAKTDTPFITGIGSGRATISLSSTTTQYTSNPAVVGVGVAGAIIKVYINDVQTGVGSSGNGGAIESIGVTLAELTEGVNELYITATQPGLAESDPSTKYTFTYDETDPVIASVVADSTANTITVTFDGPVETATSGASFPYGAMDPSNWSYNGTALDSDTATMSKTSSTVVVITPTTQVASFGTAYYITLVYTSADQAVYDLAGNYNTIDVTYAGITVP